MGHASNWMIYGATGYTGRLIAEEAVRRGHSPILAGRNLTQLESLATTLGCPSRTFSLHGGGDQVARHLEHVSAVLLCAGPFVHTAQPMREACLRAGIHYLDITGEIPVIVAAATAHEAARDAGICLIPAVGFDVVPTDCLAAMLARRLRGAMRLELAFLPPASLSRGTAKTVIEALTQGGWVRQGGRLQQVPFAWKKRTIPFREGPRTAMTVPWGDVASAWYSTRIPEIEVYLAAPAATIACIRCLRFAAGLTHLAPVRRGLQWLVDRLVVGPPIEEDRQRKSSFWGMVVDPAGHAVEATLVTPGSYYLTVLTALAAMDHVLAGKAPVGFSTPSKAFGPDWILSFPGTDFRWIEPQRPKDLPEGRMENLSIF